MELKNSPLHGCHGSGKSQGKKYFFKVREKSGNFDCGQGKMRFLKKVRENGSWSGKIRIYVSFYRKNVVKTDFFYRWVAVLFETWNFRNNMIVYHSLFSSGKVRENHVESGKSQGISSWSFRGNHVLIWCGNLSVFFDC